ncbi:probable crossover junction endonuclease EME2 [Lepisosteus oculatus]|uniref:probable crossover junction endonuclease EME2 n=1 Tax=Lepisosteus oculatus TaxID=7918 RepID=UPI0035F50542
MSLLLKRAKTWEISESEAESDSETQGRRTCACSSESQEKVPPSVDQTSTEQTEDCNKNVEIVPVCTEQAGADKRPLAPPAADGPGTPSPGKRRRRTREEVEADRVRAGCVREAREQLKKERLQIKEQRKLEQQRRKEAAERLKCYRPEQCLKYLTVCIDPAVLQDEGSDLLLGTVEALGWRIIIEEQPVSHSISWKRDLPQVEEDEASPVTEEQVLMVVTLSDFLDMVVAIKKGQDRTGEEAPPGSLYTQLCEFLEGDPEKVVTLAVIGPNPNSWTLRGRERRDRSMGSDLALKELDIEEALVFLQLHRNISVMFLPSWDELCDHMCAVTRALAKRPFKQLTEGVELPFCPDGAWAGGVRVGQDGAGLRQVWTRQIQQLNRVSPAVAAAVSAAHPSPQQLLKAYREKDSERERKALLSDLTVRNGDRARRVGPEISNRVYRYLHADNPHLVLD